MTLLSIFVSSKVHPALLVIILLSIFALGGLVSTSISHDRSNRKENKKEDKKKETEETKENNSG